MKEIRILKFLTSPKLHCKNLLNAFKVVFFRNEKLLFWASSGRDSYNFGDAINPWLFLKISGIKPMDASRTLNISRRSIYSCVGSILGWSKSKSIVVWGSGFISESSLLKQKPKSVCAVRGPLSREKLLKFGVECPEIFGDPALLIPRYYFPKIEKKFKLGIIPHYIDKEHPNFMNFCKSLPNDISIIDLELDVETVIDSILECHKIISSSLHGLIVADAYGIPSLRVKFSNNVVGGDFKFNDYFLSVGREISDSIIIDQSTTLEHLYSQFLDYSISINLDLLLDVCPFRRI